MIKDMFRALLRKPDAVIGSINKPEFSFQFDVDGIKE